MRSLLNGTLAVKKDQFKEFPEFVYAVFKNPVTNTMDSDFGFLNYHVNEVSGEKEYFVSLIERAHRPFSHVPVSMCQTVIKSSRC